MTTSKVNHKRTHQIVRSFEAAALKKRPLVAKIADFLTSYFGTFSFLVVNAVIYTTWILGNSGKIPRFPLIDPYPYSFMNWFVSLEAIILSVIVLMSQNREGQISRIRQEMQLQVNLISEKEITKILQVLKMIAEKQGVKISDPDLDEMIKEIDASFIERKLEEQMKSSEGQPIIEIEEKIKETIIPKS